MNMRSNALTLTALLASLSSTASASDLMMAPRGAMASPTPGSYDQFGDALEIDGEWAVAGVPFDDDAGTNSGRVQVFRRTGTRWSHHQTLTPSSHSSGDEFGHGVAIHGDLIVVGAPGLDDTTGGLSASGGVFVFVLNSGTELWQEVALLRDPDAQSNDRHGNTVAVNAGYVLACSIADYYPSQNSGSLGIYQRDTNGSLDPTDDSWTHAQKLAATPVIARREFGASMDLDGDRLIVGAPAEDGSVADAGSAYLFEFDGSSWGQSQRFNDPQPNVNERFGEEVAIDADLIAVGAPNRELTSAQQGAAFVYQRQFGSYQLSGVLFDANGDLQDHFGSSVGVSDGLVCIGAEAADGDGLNAGIAYLFQYDTLFFGWQVRERITAPITEDWGSFGSGLEFDGETLLVGSPASDVGGPDSGTVYAYALGAGQFERFGFCDGSGSAAPCGNESTTVSQTGCVNSTGRGARLSASGSSVAAADDIVLSASGLSTFGPALLFTGTSANDGGVPFGDGLRHAVGTLVRRGIRMPDASGVAIWGPGLGTDTVAWPAGTQLSAQVWYRDPIGSPCGSGFSLSNGLLIDFQ